MSLKNHSFTDDVMGNLDAVGISELIQSKKVSIREITEAAIARAEKVNPALNAIVVKTYEDAREIKSANSEAYFYGIPTFIKDNEDLKGYPTQFGTGIFKAKKAKANSTYVKQLLHTGLNCLGKTTLPEFGLICSAENEKRGITRNPWNTDYTTGGSSSGSAAMVASGVVPIAHANDGAGSIRIPASICGLVGLKPTRSRLVNFDGSEILPLNIGCEGILTRSVRDTARFMYEAEKFYKNPKLSSIGNIEAPLKKRLRIAFFENLPSNEMGHIDEDTNSVLKQTAELLESLGHHLEIIKIPLDINYMRGHFLNYYGFMAFIETKLAPIFSGQLFLKDKLEPFSYGLRKRFIKNILNLPKSIQVLKKEIGDAENKLFSQFDILMTPVTSIKTPQIGYLSPDLSVKEITKRATMLAPFTGMQNVSGSPAISLPVGQDSDGMPLGLQFVAAHGQDALLLQLAYELEQAQPWQKIYE